MIAVSDFYTLSSILRWIFISVATIFLVKLFFILTRRTNYAKILDAIPGPYAVPVLGNAWEFSGPYEEIFTTLEGMAKKFPKDPLFRAWLGFKGYVLIKDAKAAEEILSKMEHNTKSDDYHMLHSWLGQGLITSTGTKWHSDRKMLTPAFHFKILDDFNVIFNEQANVLITKLETLAGKGPFEIFTPLALCTLDVICESTLGLCINAQHNSESDYVKAVHGIGKVFVTRITCPWLQIPFIFNLTSWRRKEKKYTEIIHTFARKVIKERREYLKKNNIKLEDNNTDCFGQKKRRAFLDLMLLLSSEGKNLTDEEIREQVDTFTFAGHDTTATNLSWTIYLLGRHPNIQKRLQEEVDQVLGSKTTATKDDLMQLKYMEAVLKESLRLYPPVPLIGRKLKTDTTLEGYRIPAETTLFIANYFIHRDPEIFPNPDTFDPTRFLTESLQTRNPFAFVPFSAGPRNCIGQRFALQEDKVILAKIIQNFNITSRDSPEDMKLLINPILHPAEGIFISLKKRN